MSLTPEIGNLLVTLVTGGVGLTVINALFARRKTNAEAESIEADTAAKVLKGVVDEVIRLQSRLAVLEERFAESETRRQAAERKATEAERKATEAERKADEAEVRERHLLNRVAMLRSRVEYLTRIVESAGLTVEPWTPPAGIPTGE